MLENLKQLSTGSQPSASSSEIVSKVVADVTSSMEGQERSHAFKHGMGGRDKPSSPPPRSATLLSKVDLL